MKRQKKVAPPSIQELEEMGEIILWGDLEDWMEEEGITVPSDPHSALMHGDVEVLVWAEVDDTYGDDTHDFNCGQHPVRLTPVLLQTPGCFAERFPTRVRCIGYGDPALSSSTDDDEKVDLDLQEHLQDWVEWYASRVGVHLSEQELIDAEPYILESAKRGLLDYLREQGKLAFTPRAILMLPEDTTPRVHPSIPLDVAQESAGDELPQVRWVDVRRWLREQRVVQTSDSYFRLGPH